MTWETQADNATPHPQLSIYPPLSHTTICPGSARSPLSGKTRRYSPVSVAFVATHANHANPFALVRFSPKDLAPLANLTVIECEAMALQRKACL